MRNWILPRRGRGILRGKFKTGVQKQDTIYDQNGWKTTLFGVAHNYIAHLREYSPCREHYSVWNVVVPAIATRLMDTMAFLQSLEQFNIIIALCFLVSSVQRKWQVSSRTVLSGGQSRKPWPRDGEQPFNRRTNTTNERLGTIPHIAKKRFTDVASINFTILVFCEVKLPVSTPRLNKELSSWLWQDKGSVAHVGPII